MAFLQKRFTRLTNPQKDCFETVLPKRLECQTVCRRQWFSANDLQIFLLFVLVSRRIDKFLRKSDFGWFYLHSQIFHQLHFKIHDVVGQSELRNLR